MEEKNQNIEKIQKIIDIFIESVDKDYFDNLQKVHDLLHKTLFSKEYLDSLTIEKLEEFYNENSELIRYFDFFGDNNLKKLFEKKLNDFKVNLFNQFINNFNKLLEYTNNLSVILDCNFNNADKETKSYLNIFHSFLMHNDNDFLFNLINQLFIYLDKYNTNIYKFGFKYSTTTENLNFYYQFFKKITNEIPTGVLLFHFQKWHSENYVEKINIENFFLIKNIEIEISNHKEIYLLGENASGKTILLQAILFALKQESFNSFTKDLNIEFQKKNKIEKKDILFKRFPVFYNLKRSVFAYGVNRNKVTNDRSKETQNEYNSLFSDKDTELRDPVNWLLNVKFEELEAKSENRILPAISLDNAKKIIIDLLDNKIIDISVSSEKVEFIENGKSVSFSNLAQGYKSLIILITDLISRLSVEQANVSISENSDGKIVLNFEGIVLIDEIDLFLHPKWVYTIMKKLRTMFPKIHFIVTTHNPVLILGASKDAIIYKVYKDENGFINISEPYKNIDKLRIDQIITEEIFGLESSRSPHITKLLNDRTEILSKFELSSKDKETLSEIEKKLGTLPVGETKYERKAQSVIDSLAEILKKSEENDKN